MHHMRAEKRHVALTMEIQGDTRRSALEFRKHLGWYTRGLHGATALRRELQQIESLAEAEQIFRAYLESGDARRAAG